MNQERNNTFFSNDDINTILEKLKERPSKINRVLLLDLIRATAPITIYKLAKITGFSYTTLKFIIRDFEYSGIIKFRIVLGDNNRSHKLICIPEEEVNSREGENDK